jgi:hypothetical protein
MIKKKPELSIIKALSTRIVEAQRQIRILDQVKWDDFARNGAMAG